MITRTQQRRIRKLIEALRSKEYPQARGALRTNRGFCCLGVACDVAAKTDKRVGRWEPTESDDNDLAAFEFVSRDGANDSYLPRGVMDWYGFDNSEGPVLRVTRNQWGGEANKTGADLNDDGRRFSTIANALETWLEKQKVQWR